MIQVKKFFAYNELRNYSYLIFDEESGDSWIIDPYEASPMIEYIKKNSLNLRGILNTHQHHDHIRGNQPLQEAFSSPIRKLKGGERIKLDDKHELETIDSAGHTMDHQVFVWKHKHGPHALFSGDTLFNAGVGNCKNGGDVNSLYQTVQELLSRLPAETVLYPGHDYVEKNLLFAQSLEPDNSEIRERLKWARSADAENRGELKLGEEMKVNPFFRLESEEIRSHLGSKDLSAEARRELFIKIRSLRDKW